MNGPPIGPGPWAGGYQFPDGTGVAPSDPTAPVISGNPLPPGTTGNPPPAPQPTLGDVATMGGTAPEAPGAPAAPGDYNSIFLKNLALTAQVHAPSLRKPLSEESKPGLLANIFTFGMAGLAERDYRRGYNVAVERDNAKIRAQAVDDAVKLTQYSAVSDRAALGQQMQILRLMEQQQQNQLTNLYRDLNYNQRRDVARGAAGSVPPPTPEHAAAYRDQGMIWVADAPGTLGSKGGHLEPIDGGGGGVGGGGAGGGGRLGGLGGGGGAGGPQPPKPESPLDDVEWVGGAGGPPPPPTGAGAAPGRRPLPPTSEELRRQKQNEAVELERRKKTAAEQGKLEGARKTVGEPTLKQLDDMIAATDVLPSGQTVGGVVGSYSGFTGALNRMRLKREGGEPGQNDPEAIRKLRALKSGDFLIQQLYRMSAVGVATEQDVKPYADRLRGMEGMTAQEARNALIQTRDFVRMRMGLGGAPTEASTGAPPTGGGGGAGGITTSQDYLKKFQ